MSPDISASTSCASFGLDVTPDGAIDGKLFVHEERTTGTCEDNYVVTGQIE